MLKFVLLVSFFTAAFAVKVYKDVFSGDVMFTDDNEMRLVDDILYEVQGKMIPIKQQVDDEEGEGAVVHVIDVVYNNKLVETGFMKRLYISYMNEYKARIVEKLKEDSPDQVDVFEANIDKVIKRVLGRFQFVQFFTGKSMDSDGMIAFSEYRNVVVDGEEENIPFFYFFKHGLEEKIVSQEELANLLNS